MNRSGEWLMTAVGSNADSIGKPLVGTSYFTVVLS